MYVCKAQQQGSLPARALVLSAGLGSSSPPPPPWPLGVVFPLCFRVFRDLGAAMATAGSDVHAAKGAANKIPRATGNPGWPAVTGYAVLTLLAATPLCCAFSLIQRTNCQAAVSFPWPKYLLQNPLLACAASGLCLDTSGTANRTHRLKMPTGAKCQLSSDAVVTCISSTGYRVNPALARGSPSSAAPATQGVSTHLPTGRIAPQSVAKTFFQMQARLEPMTLEERGRTGLTSKATGNPFAFAERPANRTSPLNSFSFGPLLFTGPTERWRLWRLWTDLLDVTTCAHSLIKGPSHPSPSGWQLAHNTDCKLLRDAAALPLPRHCIVVCRQQRPLHTAGEEHDCPECISFRCPWHRLEATSPGANPSSAELSLTACPDTQVLNRFEVSSPGPYSLSQEIASASLDLPQVATPYVLCLHLHSLDLSYLPSCESIFCGACWTVAHNTAHTSPSSTAVLSQARFRQCLLLFPPHRSWPSALPRVRRLLGPLPKLDPPPGQAPPVRTPTRTTAPRDMFILLSLRLPALPWPQATHPPPQHRYRRLHGLRFSPAQRPKPRRSSHHTRFQVLHRRTQRAFLPPPMLRCPATGLIRSWGGGGGGGVHVYFPPYTATPALPHIAGYEHTFTLSSRAIPPKAAAQRRRRLDRPEGPTETMHNDHRPGHRRLFDVRQLTVMTDAGSQPRAKDQLSMLRQPMSLNNLAVRLRSSLSVLACPGSTHVVSGHSRERPSVSVSATVLFRCVSCALLQWQVSSASCSLCPFSGSALSVTQQPNLSHPPVRSCRPDMAASTSSKDHHEYSEDEMLRFYRSLEWPTRTPPPLTVYLLPRLQDLLKRRSQTAPRSPPRKQTARGRRDVHPWMPLQTGLQVHLQVPHPLAPSWLGACSPPGLGRPSILVPALVQQPRASGQEVHPVAEAALLLEILNDDAPNPEVRHLLTVLPRRTPLGRSLMHSSRPQTRRPRVYTGPAPGTPQASGARSSPPPIRRRSRSPRASHQPDRPPAPALEDTTSTPLDANYFVEIRVDPSRPILLSLQIRILPAETSEAP